MQILEKSSNVVWHTSTIRREHRQQKNGHGSAILWFTGLSGAGKSTLAHAVEERLHQMGCRTYVLDGDNVRQGLCGDLGFSPDDRTENIRRIGEVAKLMIDAGQFALTAFISPYRSDRERVRGMVMHGEFIEIYCHCDVDVCEARDVKGLYKRARAGEVKDFTGISSPYETPFKSELVVDTAHQTLQACVDQVLLYLHERGLVPSEL
jgi:adenylylsulfate kinase